MLRRTKKTSRSGGTTPKMRHEPGLRNAETVAVMDTEEITFEDLLTDESAEAAQVDSLDQLRAQGFPQSGGLAQLAAIVQLADPGRRFVALQQRYLEILELQTRVPMTRTPTTAASSHASVERPHSAARTTIAPDPTRAS